MDILEFAKFLAYASMFSVILPFIGFFKVRYKTDVIKLLLTLICVSFISDIGGFIYSKIGGNGAWVTNIYFLLQFILVCVIFTILCEQMKGLVYPIGGGCILFFILNSLYLQPLSTFQSNIATFQDVFIIVFGFVYYYFVLKELELGHLLRYSSFWIVTSLFLYSLLSVFIFAISSFVFSNLPSKYGMMLWMFHNVTNILKNFMFFLAMVYTKRRTPPIIRLRRQAPVFQ